MTVENVPVNLVVPAFQKLQVRSAVLRRLVPPLAVILFLTALGGFAAVVPLAGSGPVPLDQLRVKNPAVLPMTGEWKFKIDSGKMTAKGFVPGTSEGRVTASSSEEGHQPEDALAGGDETRWCAADGDLPQWWRVNLGKPATLSRIHLIWEKPEATYGYKIEGSANGRRWTELAQGSMPGSGADVALNGASARWLRINTLSIREAGRARGSWASIRLVKIYTTEDGTEREWKLPPPPPVDMEALNRFTQPQFDDSGWTNIPVPANWEMLGFSRPTYDQPDSAVGLYRKWIQVPGDFAGQRVLWHFDGVNNGAEIFINGRQAGYHESGYTAFDVDVTDALRPGQSNLVALRVIKNTPSVDLDTGDYWCLGGIFRETCLVALPPTHVQDITLTTDLDAQYKNATLNAAVQVHSAPATKVQLEGSVFTLSGKRVKAPQFTVSGTTDDGGAATLQLSSPVTAPALWSAEKPNLYYLVLELKQDSRTVERVQERFGFHKIEIKNGILLWNGAPIKCTGCCRHEIWPTLGKALNEAAWRTDLKLMKAANINAIRTSHYNFAARFLELCDEEGIYILDEIPFCWCNTRDPSLKPAFLQRARETLARDKNRACVLAWSLGNENGFGPNVQAVVDYVSAADPVHPKFASESGPRQYPGVDFSDHHYPGFAELKRIDRDSVRTRIPAVITEEPHTYYTEGQSGAVTYDPGCKDLWGESLATVWNIVWPSTNILGSFIWEWQDQGIADKFPGGGDRDAAHLRLPAHKGIVDSYRHLRTEYWHVKMVYSPVTTSAREIEVENGRCTVPLQNRYAFTDLSELTCRWQAVAAGKQLAQGQTHLACPPGASTKASFSVPAGAEALQLEFIHPDGRNIYSAKLAVKGKPESVPWTILTAGGPLKVDETPSEIRISNHLTTLTADKATGSIQWQVNGETLLQRGPILNLGELGPRDNKYLVSRQPPELKPVSVSAIAADDAVCLQVAGDATLAAAPESLGQFTCTLLVAPDAQIGVQWSLKWNSKAKNVWELGLKLPLPARYTEMSWLRDAQWTDYPADHLGRPEGAASSQDVAFRATHRNVQWMLLSDGRGGALALLNAGGPLQARASANAETTMLFASQIVAVPEELASDLLPQYRIRLAEGTTVSGAFRLAAVHPRNRGVSIPPTDSTSPITTAMGSSHS